MDLQPDMAAWPPAPDASSPPGGGGVRLRMPQLGELQYAKEFITVGLLLLALPWVLAQLARNPGGLLAGLGARQVTKVT